MTAESVSSWSSYSSQSSSSSSVVAGFGAEVGDAEEAEAEAEAEAVMEPLRRGGMSSGLM